MIDIDFVRRRRVPVLELALLLAAFAILLHRIAVWRELAIDEQGARARVEALERQLVQQERAERQRTVEAAPLAERRRQRLERVAAALDYPWERILSVIEAPDMQGITLQSFSHDVADREVRLSIDAADLQSLARYVEQLNKASFGKSQISWYVTGYQVQTAGGPLRAAVSGMVAPVGAVPVSSSAVHR